MSVTDYILAFVMSEAYREMGRVTLEETVNLTTAISKIKNKPIYYKGADGWYEIMPTVGVQPVSREEWDMLFGRVKASNGNAGSH